MMPQIVPVQVDLPKGLPIRHAMAAACARGCDAVRDEQQQPLLFRF